MLQILYFNHARICLEFELEDDTIIAINFCDHALNSVVEGALSREILRQMEAWFAGEIRGFDLPFFATGTPFQLMVWEETLKIPYGETISYGELAQRIGRPKAARAVGAALGANPIPIIIPCHRIVGSTGKLTGFGGGLKIKSMLLAHEQEVLKRS
ncbi:MAG: methylated-DNA--[protein]-cysteine S-methyltransferase [Candidatus Cloacimonadaceae bacterium]